MKFLLSTIVTALLVFMATAPIAERVLGPYEVIFARYVDDDGLVNYWELKATRGMDAAYAEFSGVTPAQYETWNADDRIAFWINAYNAFTLKLIVDNYPIKLSTGKSKFPANSIRQIPGAWELKKFKALGKDVTLDQIEHQILRGEFKDQRIHMALVCAAMSCPKLRREPYRGDILDQQLDDQAAEFLTDLTKFHIDREADEVWASPIFDWFVDDFLPGATKDYPREVAQRKSLTAFAAKYLSPEDARYLEEGKYVVKYFEYDWTLNEQPK